MRPARPPLATAREVSAGIIIYRRTKEGPRFLLLFHGGRYWNFPKGKLEAGEKSFRAAVRETWEETGLSFHDLKFKQSFSVSEQYTFLRERRRIFKTVTYFLAETGNAHIKLPKPGEGVKGEEHHGYGWFLYREALPLMMHANLRKMLKRSYDTVVQRKNMPGSRTATTGVPTK
ncbi:MAG: NUDIX domain-containing protein [Candidatus Jorgensenbacteria bacterium]